MERPTVQIRPPDQKVLAGHKGFRSTAPWSLFCCYDAGAAHNSCLQARRPRVSLSHRHSGSGRRKMRHPAGAVSTRHSDRGRAGGQVAGAAAAGAILAGALTWIWHASLAAGRTSCTDPGQVCIGPDLVGIAAGVLVGTVGSLTACAMLGLRPLPASWAAATLATLLVVPGVAAARPGGHPPAAWAVIPVLAAAFALVATIFVSVGRPRITAAVLAAVLLAAAVLVPHLINHSVQAQQQRARLAALPFPLLVPVVAGYKVIDAYPEGDTLDLDMVTAGSRPDEFGAYDDIAISVTIGPLSDPYLSAVLAGCQRASDGLTVLARTCRRLHPEEWTTSGTDIGTEGVIALKSRIIVLATTNSSPSVAVRALAEAATQLRPASLSEILALENAP